MKINYAQNNSLDKWYLTIYPGSFILLECLFNDTYFISAVMHIKF